MPLIRTCQRCGQKNRIPAKHLANTGRCGVCKAALPPVDEPLEVDPELFRRDRPKRPRSTTLLTLEGSKLLPNCSPEAPQVALAVIAHWHGRRRIEVGQAAE